MPSIVCTIFPPLYLAQCPLPISAQARSHSRHFGKVFPSVTSTSPSLPLLYPSASLPSTAKHLSRECFLRSTGEGIYNFPTSAILKREKIDTRFISTQTGSLELLRSNGYIKCYRVFRPESHIPKSGFWHS